MRLPKQSTLGLIWRRRKNSGEKSNKCNHCDNASYKTDYCRTHLKIHSKEKSNKFNQCENTSSQIACFHSSIWKHTSEKSQTKAISVTLHLQAISKHIKKTFLKNRKKSKNEIFVYASSETVDLRAHLKTHSGRRKKSNKCNQCDFAYSHTGNLRTHLKTSNGKRQTKAASVTMHLFKQAVLGLIWKHTVEKSQTNAASLTIHNLKHAMWVHIRVFQKNTFSRNPKVQPIKH